MIFSFFKKAIFTFAFITLVIVCKAQSDAYQSDPVEIVLYYNLNWELTTQENSFFKREAYFDLKDMVFDGVYKDFNKAGVMIGEGYYQHGVRAGIQSEYYDDRSVKTTIEITTNDFIIWQKMTPDKKYEVIRGTGKFSMHYYYLFDLRVKQGDMEGEFLNGMKTGIWIYKDVNGVKTDTERYEDGKLMEHKVFRRTDSLSVNYGKEIILSLNSVVTPGLVFDKSVFKSVNEYFERYVSYPEDFNRVATFPGGIKHLIGLLMSQFSIPEKMLFIARLKLDEHGNILRAVPARPLFEDTDDRLIDFLKSMNPYFLPAVQNGRPVPSVLYVPVASGNEWSQMLKELPSAYFTNISNFE
jgi:antitoxin component YwqK of YwqJK toxin-antitoxin module